MNIVYWTGFSKRKNSTKVPSGSGTTKTCVLKDETSIMEPVIILQGHGYFNLNYAYIADFGRYYFVTDIRTKGPNTEVSLTCDVLATYKSAITGSFQFVDRAAQAGIAPANVPDPLNPPSNAIEVKSTQIMSFADSIVDNSDDHYILAVNGKTGVEYWMMTGVQVSTLFDKIFDSGLISQIANGFYDFKDCIISLKKSTYGAIHGDPGQQVFLGEKGIETSSGVPFTATQLNSTPISEDSGLVLLNMPSDDHLNIRSYPYYAPYSIATLYLPLVGIVPVDLQSVASDGKLGVHAWVDQFTGDLVYRVYTSGDRTIGTYYGKCTADLPVASQNYNATGLVGSLVTIAGGAAASLLSGGTAGVAVGVAAATSGAVSVAENIKINSQVNGTLSSCIGGKIGGAVICNVYTNSPVDWDIENMRATQGVIVSKQMSLASLSGYVQCKNAHVSITGSDKEHDLIESLMNSGIFIE